MRERVGVLFTFLPRFYGGASVLEVKHVAALFVATSGSPL